jgi:hypothetical protein
LHFGIKEGRSILSCALLSSKKRGLEARTAAFQDMVRD